MSEFYRIDDYRRPTCKAFFDRNELNQLLSLYSSHVAAATLDSSELPSCGVKQ